MISGHPFKLLSGGVLDSGGPEPVWRVPGGVPNGVPRGVGRPGCRDALVYTFARARDRETL